MKKYLIAVLLLFIPCVTYALTMCARDNSLVISLVPGYKATSVNYDNYTFEWGATMAYGRILGEATCLSDDEKNKYTDAENKISQDLPKAFKGNDDQGSVRGDCYCRITHPALSRWVLMLDNYHTSCSAFCAQVCSQRMSDAAGGSRQALFNAIGK